MKKKVLVIIAAIIAIIAIGAMIYASVELNKNKNEADKHLIEITFNELQEKVNNKETFVLLFSQTDCSHCASFKPKLKNVLMENNLVGYEINLKKLSKEEDAKLLDIVNIGTGDNRGTPTTAFIINGEEKRVSSQLKGDVEEATIRNRLKQLGFIE